MRSAIFLIVLLSGPAVAGDFRTADIGASCATVASQETALGSREIKWSVEGLGIVAFEGKAFGRELIFTYFCPKGFLFTGNYYFPVETLNEAIASYESVHKQLSATFGAPWLDNSPWMQPAVDPRWLQSDPKYYMTTWDTSRLRVSTSIMPSQEGEPKGWRIFMVYGGDLPRERSNNSLERTRER